VKHFKESCFNFSQLFCIINSDSSFECGVNQFGIVNVDVNEEILVLVLSPWNSNVFGECENLQNYVNIKLFQFGIFINSHRLAYGNNPLPLLQRTKSTSWSSNIHEVFVLPIGYNPLQSQSKVRKLPQLEVPLGEVCKSKLGSDE